MKFIKNRFIIFITILLTAFLFLRAAESDFDNLQTSQNIAVYEGLTIKDIIVTGEVRLTEDLLEPKLIMQSKVYLIQNLLIELL